MTPWLNGWKEIAKWMGVSIRTAKKRYYIEDLPVHRVDHRVSALKAELNSWMVARKLHESCTKAARIHTLKMGLVDLTEQKHTCIS